VCAHHGKSGAASSFFLKKKNGRDGRRRHVPSRNILGFIGGVAAAGGMIRAAFDVGSGATKLLVVEVAPAASTGDTGKIVRELFGQEVPLPFKGDSLRSADGRLSAEIMEKGMRTLQTFKDKAESLGAVMQRGVATEVFRTAPNGVCVRVCVCVATRGSARVSASRACLRRERTRWRVAMEQCRCASPFILSKQVWNSLIV